MSTLSIFYDEIINDCLFDDSTQKDKIYNIYFNTVIPELNVSLFSESNRLIPTLFIKNKSAFDSALMEYMKTTNIPISDKEAYKSAMLLLWANALPEDFNNPVEFIKRRIAFLNDKTFDELDNGIVPLGYSNILGGQIEATYQEETLEQETKKSIAINVYNNETKETYSFPVVKMGIEGDTAYIYAVQQVRNKKMENPFEKKVNRALYKIGEGFDSEKDNFEIYDDGNLKDVSASFLVCLNIILGMLESKGIKNIAVPSILLIRYNAKTESYIKRNNYYNNGNPETFKEYESKQLGIQKNLTEKFLRTFLRLVHHHNGLDVTSYPFDMDSYLHLYNSGELQCNNSLLDETYNIGKNYSKSRSL